MKKSIPILMATFVVTLLLCCTQDQNLDEPITSSTRNTNEDIKEIIQSDVNNLVGEVVEFDIIKIVEIENDNLISFNISFKTESNFESNIVVVRRKNYIEGSGDVEHYVVTCSGCDNCGVTSTDTGNGNLQHSCWEACCSMTIDEGERSDNYHLLTSGN